MTFATQKERKGVQPQKRGIIYQTLDPNNEKVHVFFNFRQFFGGNLQSSTQQKAGYSLNTFAIENTLKVVTGISQEEIDVIVKSGSILSRAHLMRLRITPSYPSIVANAITRDALKHEKEEYSQCI